MGRRGEGGRGDITCPGDGQLVSTADDATDAEILQALQHWAGGSSPMSSSSTWMNRSVAEQW